MRLFLWMVAMAACQRAAVPSTTPIINSEITGANGTTMLAGHCSPAMLQKGNYAAWYHSFYNAYQVDTTVLPVLATLLQPITIEVFLGTWCGDSKREVPRLMKILEAAHFDTARLRLIFVEHAPARYKQSPQHEERDRFIHHVPTIILHNGCEKGRIVETPVVSLEKDMLAILSGKAYTPKYPASAFLQHRLGRAAKALSPKQLSRLYAQLQPLCTSSRELNTLGYVWTKQQQYNQAFNVLQLNALLYPTDAGVFTGLAELSAVNGNKTQARYYYEKVLQLNPGDTNALKQLAVLP